MNKHHFLRTSQEIEVLLQQAIDKMVKLPNMFTIGNIHHMIGSVESVKHTIHDNRGFILGINKPYIFDEDK